VQLNHHLTGDGSGRRADSRRLKRILSKLGTISLGKVIIARIASTLINERLGFCGLFCRDMNGHLI
jgi:hypothetical protein